MPSGAVKTVFYSDFDFRFLPHPKTGALTIVKNAEAVTQAVKLLVLTQLQERPFRPFVGSTVRGSLFENFSSITKDKLEQGVKRAIENIEPRAVLLDVKAVQDIDSNALYVTIVYRPVITFSLDKLR